MKMPLIPQIECKEERGAEDGLRLAFFFLLRYQNVNDKNLAKCGFAVMRE